MRHTTSLFFCVVCVSIGVEHGAHYVSPESYQVTWWPGDAPHTDISSASTSGKHLLLTGLRHSTVYTVVVQGRRLGKCGSGGGGVDEAGAGL